MLANFLIPTLYNDISSLQKVIYGAKMCQKVRRTTLFYVAQLRLLNEYSDIDRKNGPKIF